MVVPQTGRWNEIELIQVGMTLRMLLSKQIEGDVLLSRTCENPLIGYHSYRLTFV